MNKSDYDLINLGACIKGQADRLGIKHEGIPLEGVVVRIANVALSRAAAPEPEWEWAVQVAGLNSSEPMYFEFPDPLAADRFIKNGALWYSPRPNGDPKTLVRRRKAGPWLPVGGDDAE